MKTMLLIIAMLIGCVCFGQKKDSLPTTAATFNVAILAARSGSMLTETRQISINDQKPDTVKVMMLVCDTTFIKNHTSIAILYDGVGRSDTVGYSPNRSIQVWWQFGYEIRRGIESGAYIMYMGRDGNIITDPSSVRYLDENKKPLPKSIVVWITKEIN